MNVINRRSGTIHRGATWSARRREAVALAYDAKQDAAPRVIARGRGRVATAIIAKAEESGVPVVSDSVALEALRLTEVGDVIPPKVYHIVADVLAFVYAIGERPKEPW